MEHVDHKEIEVFSPEERSEIIARIEKASARDAVAVPGLPSKNEARKRGIFPILVNAGAAVLLAAGILLLLSFQRTNAVEIVESGAALGITERALIRAIRSDINSLLYEKEQAIDDMNKRIAEVDLELGRLNSLETLTSEQQAAMEALMAAQKTYQESLAELYQERAQILTQARTREAAARQQEETFEQQVFTENVSAQSRAEIEKAREELLRLSSDAEKMAFIETLLSAAYSNQSAPVIQIQVEEPPPGASAEELRQQITTLTVSIREQNQKNTELSAGLAEAQQTLKELQNNITVLQDRNDTFSQTIAEKDKQIDALQRTISNVSSALEDKQ